MSVPSWLWVALTLGAATAQTFRNVAQRSLTGELGTIGATHVRFLFGLPFALMSLGIVALLVGPLPPLNWASFAWAAMGGVGQILATALMLAAMQQRSFVVATAYTKTEPLQIALFALVFLGEQASALLVVAIVVATAGVVLLSWPARSGSEIFSWRPAVLGIVSGGLFAIAAVGYRGAIVALGDANFLAAATLTLAVALGVQTALLTLWLFARDPGVLRAIAKAWRPSLAAGFLGALASQMWFTAFAIKSPAAVRTLALVEILIAGIVSRRLFAHTPGLRDIGGLVMVTVGIALLLSG